MNLAEKLVYLRKSKGLSQVKLAEMMHISRQAVSKWETGAAVPSLDSLKYLCRLYEVSLDYLSDDVSHEPQRAKDAAAAPVDKPDLIQDKEDVPGNRNVKRWIAAVSVLVLLILAVCVYMLMSVEKGGDSVLIDDMPKEEVSISIGSGFDIEF